MNSEQQPFNSLGLYAMPETSPTLSELYGPPSSSSYSSFNLVTPSPFMPIPLPNLPMYNPFPLQLQLPQRYYPTAAPTDLFPTFHIDESSIPPTSGPSPCSEREQEPEAASIPSSITLGDCEQMVDSGGPPQGDGKKKKRSRTAQACEKCRIRKARCFGGQPCNRCTKRGFRCEFASPTKPRSKLLTGISTASLPLRTKRRTLGEKTERVEATAMPVGIGLGLGLGRVEEGPVGLGLGISYGACQPLPFNEVPSLVSTPMCESHHPGHPYLPGFPLDLPYGQLQEPVSPYDAPYHQDAGYWYGAAFQG